MVAQRINLAEHDATAGVNSFKNYGPANVSAGFTITDIRVKGSIAYPPLTTTVGITLEHFLQYGIQHGATGYTATTPEAITAPGPEWLQFESTRVSGLAVVTLHNTPGSDETANTQVDLNWRGQLLTPAGTDVYFSIGRIFNASINWYFQGSMVITYG